MAGRIILPGAHAHRSPSRRKGFYRLLSSFPECRVESNGIGQPIIVGPDGFEPLHHPDPAVRILFAYGAARWGCLYDSLANLAFRLNRLHRGLPHDRQLTSFAAHELFSARPPEAVLRAVLERRDQLELALTLDEGAA
jgi:hypothetical protein